MNVKEHEQLQNLANRIRSAKTVEYLNKCDKSLTNLYNNGTV